MINLILAACLISSLVFGAIIYLLKFFDLKGMVASVLISTAIAVLAPPWWFVSVILSYVIIIVATLYRNDEKAKIRGTKVEEAKKRSYTNVLGKVLTPLISAVFGNAGMLIASITYGIADSISHEIGILSKKKPVLVNNGKQAEPGTSGAISVLGTASGIAVSLLVGMLISLLAFSTVKPSIVLFAFLTGTVGNFIDSFFGAFIENKGFLRGWQVNFISSVLTGLLGLLIYPSLV